MPINWIPPTERNINTCDRKPQMTHPGELDIH